MKYLNLICVGGEQCFAEPDGIADDSREAQTRLFVVISLNIKYINFLFFRFEIELDAFSIETMSMRLGPIMFENMKALSLLSSGFIYRSANRRGGQSRCICSPEAAKLFHSFGLHARTPHHSMNKNPFRNTFQYLWNGGTGERPAFVSTNSHVLLFSRLRRRTTSLLFTIERLWPKILLVFSCLFRPPALCT